VGGEVQNPKKVERRGGQIPATIKKKGHNQDELLEAKETIIQTLRRGKKRKGRIRHPRNDGGQEAEKKRGEKTHWRKSEKVVGTPLSRT